jgi:hypothetical protein
VTPQKVSLTLDGGLSLLSEWVIKVLMNAKSHIGSRLGEIVFYK